MAQWSLRTMSVKLQVASCSISPRSARNSKCTAAPGLKVCDAAGQSLAYIYSRENDSDARMAKVLTEDEARRIASNIAKLPTFLAKGG
jgi:hypothetical protein